MKAQRSQKRIWVVKIGGSLVASSELASWLQACADLGGRIVLVPGGGPYADAVRSAQAEEGFNDAAAHALALGAMEKFGQWLCAHQSGLVPAATRLELDAILARGLTPVWMPSAMTLAEASIPQDWSVTSDSLAAWLAVQLHATGLVLVKSVASVCSDSMALAANGVVDAAFPQFAASVQRVHLLRRREWPRLATFIGAAESTTEHV